MLKVVNSKGRTLLEVTKENEDGTFDYSEPGHGGGYGVTLTQLIQNIDWLKMDYPSAKVVNA